MKRTIQLSILIASLLSASYVCAEEETAKKDHTPIYHIYADINMKSTVKYENEKKMVMKYVYPQLTTETPDEFIDKFNAQILDIKDQITAEFKQKVQDNESTLKSLPKELAKGNNNLQVDYDSSTVESGDNYIVSIRFSVSGMIVGMAHPYHYYRVFNYNLDTGEQLELNQLFNPDADYLAVLSNYTRGELEKRLSDKEMVAEGTSPKPENFKNWSVKPNGLLITFDETQVAPYVEGAQTVLVPYSVLKPIIAKDAVIAGCIKHRKSCANSNLLTGGFIDEAAAETKTIVATKESSQTDSLTFGQTARKLLGYPLSLIHRT